MKVDVQNEDMPTRSRREDAFISQFLSAYESFSWADANLDWLDKRLDRTVEVLATRPSDGQTLAIEHTIIEPFVGEKEDFAFFEAAFLRIEEDDTLAVPGLWIQIFVPVGLLRNRPKAERNSTVRAVHEWIRSNRLILSEGISQHPCPVFGPRRPASEIMLTVKVVGLQSGQRATTGVVHVRRQQTEDSLGTVVARTLARKLPKLVRTPADKRILMVERQHMNLDPLRIVEEIGNQKPTFPELAQVDEIWIVETIFHGTEFGGTYLRFELYDGGEVIKTLEFDRGLLVATSEHGVSTFIRSES